MACVQMSIEFPKAEKWATIGQLHFHCIHVGLPRVRMESEEGTQLLLHHHEDLGNHFPGSGEKVYIYCSI